MPLECINPDDLPIPEMYTQVVVATGSKLVFVSGQQPEDINGKLVGHGNFAAQARLAFGNLGRALAAAGARPEQVCKITVYVVEYRRDEHVPIIEAAQIALFGPSTVSQDGPAESGFGSYRTARMRRTISLLMGIPNASAIWCGSVDIPRLGVVTAAERVTPPGGPSVLEELSGVSETADDCPL